MSAPNASSSRDAAVIDIGSNSVRLVIYRLDGRAIWTVFNEKVLAGLGRDVARTRRLSPEGVATTLTTLKRFKAVLGASDHYHVSAVAPAAVGEEVDGPDFVRQVREETGLEVRVLTGPEEARYSALGVLAGAPEADGLAGDLGGSSLELTAVAGGEPREGISLPLGPFALRSGEGFDANRVRQRAGKVLDRIDNRRFATRSFYAVGGGWRNLALLQMRIAGYPLQIVHQYDIPSADALDTARFIARQSKGSLDRIPGVSRRRLETIPYAAIVLESLIERLGIERITISAYGLREGLLFEAMEPSVRALDPLIEGCLSVSAREGVDQALGPALEAWLTPVFSRLTPLFEGRDSRLNAAACHLADLGARLHPDHRADLVFEQVLRAPIPGLSHPERAFLAVALFARHTASAPEPEPDVLHRVLSDDRYQRARALGAAVRLGCDLSGRNAWLLGKSRLEIQGPAIRLSADDRWADMLLGEQTAKRASTLADQLDLGLKIGGR